TLPRYLERGTLSEVAPCLNLGSLHPTWSPLPHRALLFCSSYRILFLSSSSAGFCPQKDQSIRVAPLGAGSTPVSLWVSKDEHTAYHIFSMEEMAEPEKIRLRCHHPM
ncbi:mCG146320, partial [Mus musculus]